MRTTNTRTTTKALALGFAGAVALSTLAIAPQATAAPNAKAGPVLVKRTPYKCTPTNSVINSITGTQKFLVTTHASIPKSVKGGSNLAIKNVQLDLILPASLTKIIREDLNVDKVGGTADAVAVVSSTPGGTKNVKISNLSAPFTKVPNGEMTIKAPGNAAGYKVAGNAKSLTVKMPKKFVIHAKLTPPPFGVKKTDLNCVASGKPALIKKVNVS